MSKKANKEIVIDLLKSAAEGLEIRFNAPVYLVGSYITKGNDALDIDIVQVFTPDQMKRIFDVDDDDMYRFNDRHMRFRLKQKAWLEEHATLWDFDYKEQSIDMFKHYAKKSEIKPMRLSTWADKDYLEDVLNE